MSNPVLEIIPSDCDFIIEADGEIKVRILEIFLGHRLSCATLQTSEGSINSQSVPLFLTLGLSTQNKRRQSKTEFFKNK